MAPTRAPRRGAAAPKSTDITPVRLTRKYAEIIDGVDLSAADVGDRLELPPHEAEVLIAEGWAEPARRENPGRRSGDNQSVADDRRGPRRRSAGR